MSNVINVASSRCAKCATVATLPQLAMAFQPIVDVNSSTVFAFEALVRGGENQSAAWVIDQIDDENRYAFDQACRVLAVQTAARLGTQARLSINFLPNAVYEPERCLQTTLKAARACAFPPERILFEVSETEGARDPEHLKRIFVEYRRHGFATAIDDFGAGYSGLGLLASFQPDYLKIDMSLVRGLDTDPARRAIVRHVVSLCHDLGVVPIAEGLETRDEVSVVRDMGVSLLQGYFFARPALDALPVPVFESASGN